MTANFIRRICLRGRNSQHIRLSRRSWTTRLEKAAGFYWIEATVPNDDYMLAFQPRFGCSSTRMFTSHRSSATVSLTRTKWEFPYPIPVGTQETRGKSFLLG